MVKKIGIITGREYNFPNALIEAIHHKGKGEVVAEMATMGAGYLGELPAYDLIYDRISHDYPYYRNLLKAAVASGTYVIPNPMLWSADDKYLGFTLAADLGLTVPKTCLLPIAGSTQLYDITAESLGNLKFLDHSDWQAIFDHIGFPCWLKPASGGGWLAVSKVHNPDEFFHLYNNEIFHTKPVYPEDADQDRAVRNWLSRTLVFMLQEDIAYQQFGTEKVRIGRIAPQPLTADTVRWLETGCGDIAGNKKTTGKLLKGDVFLQHKDQRPAEPITHRRVLTGVFGVNRFGMENFVIVEVEEFILAMDLADRQPAAAESRLQPAWKTDVIENRLPFGMLQEL